MPPKRQAASKAESQKSPIQPGKPNTKPPAATEKEPKLLTINCIVKEESIPFPVEILSSETVADLKKAIKKEKGNSLTNINAGKLTLNLIPSGATKEGLGKSTPRSIKSPDDELKKLGEIFPKGAKDDLVYIIVELPRQVQKRGRDEDTELPSKKSRTGTDNADRVYTIEDAIKKAGLAGKGLVNGRAKLSLLNMRERVEVLSCIGNSAEDSIFYTIHAAARTLRTSKTKVQDMDTIDAPSNKIFPIVESTQLFVREEYESLYSDIVHRINRSRKPSQNRVVVTGTPGIGNSAFLVYLAIRLLAESNDSEPPIIIYQTKWNSRCFVYGGVSIILTGDLKDFTAFLNLSETWYLVDSSPRLELFTSRTIISASPMALIDQYKEVVKSSPLYYHMAPWTLDELEECRTRIKDFNIVSQDLMNRLFNKIGGIPRYVLQAPAVSLGTFQFPNDDGIAEITGYRPIQEAIDFIRNPALLLESFSQGKSSLEHSGHILHRLPKPDHRDYYLNWASPYIKEEVIKQLVDRSWSRVLDDLVQDGKGVTRGFLFEVYVQHIFRTGGFDFEIMDLETGLPAGTLHIPAKLPRVEVLKIDEFSDLALQPNQQTPLFIPVIPNCPCINLAMAPNKLFQVTVSSNHAIKQTPFRKILEGVLGDNWEVNGNMVELYFVVPSDIYDNFKVQKYHTEGATVSEAVPGIITRCVKQYALKINLNDARQGRSLGVTPSGSDVSGSGASAMVD